MKNVGGGVKIDILGDVISDFKGMLLVDICSE